MLLFLVLRVLEGFIRLSWFVRVGGSGIKFDL